MALGSGVDASVIADRDDRPDPRRHAPATKRNRDAILEVLRTLVTGPATILEIASGTGEHACWFAEHLPKVTWIPSDADEEMRASVAAWARQGKHRNIALPPRVIDTRTSDVKTYDSLAKVFGLYRTLGGGVDLDTFAFILGWTEFDAEKKRELYAEHACHELNFFLHQKDQEFFKNVVQPYIANKAHKTFLDRWLLDEDLTRYLDPWAFSRLNVVERILLTGRTSGLAASGARHIRELLELVPPNQEREGRLFSFFKQRGSST